MRRFACRLFGHRWESRSQACGRCHVTRETLLRASHPPEDPGDAYWCGIADGRALGRREGYRAGYRRGARHVLFELRTRLHV